MAPFLEAWALVLQGRISEIQSPIAPKGHNTSGNPLYEFSMEPAAEHVLANHHMSLTGLAGWMLPNVSSFFTSLENRMVCVPASTMAKLHEEAVDRMGDKPAPILSDGDVLCAWWTKLLLASAGVPQNPNRTVVLNNAYSLHKVLFGSHVASGDLENLKTVPDSNNIFVSNVAAFFTVILTAGDILQQPLYRTALDSKELLSPKVARST